MFRLSSRATGLRTTSRCRPTFGTPRCFHVSRSCQSFFEPLAAAVPIGYPVAIALVALAPHAIRFLLVDTWETRRDLKIQERILPFILAKRALRHDTDLKQKQFSIQEPLTNVTKQLTDRLQGPNFRYKSALFIPTTFNILWTAEMLWLLGGDSPAAHAISKSFSTVKSSTEALLNSSPDSGTLEGIGHQFASVLGSLNVGGLEFSIPAFVVASVIVQQGWRYLTESPFMSNLRLSFVTTWPSSLRNLFFWPEIIPNTENRAYVYPGWLIIGNATDIIPSLLGRGTRRQFFIAVYTITAGFFLSLSIAASCNSAQLLYLFSAGVVGLTRILCIRAWTGHLLKRQPDHVRAWTSRLRRWDGKLS